MITTNAFRLHVFMTPTGLRFAIISGTETPRLDQTLKYLYGLYSELVLKNPLYNVGDIINCDSFHKSVKQHLQKEIFHFKTKH